MGSLIPPGMKIALNLPLALVICATLALIGFLAYIKVIDATFLTHLLAFIGGLVVPGSPLSLTRIQGAATRIGDPKP